MSKSRKGSAVQLTPDQAAVVHWFIDHLSFSDFQAAVPPHLGKDAVTDKAYEIRDALAAVQRQLPYYGSSGDWMYRLPRDGDQMNPTSEFPATPCVALPLTPSAVQRGAESTGCFPLRGMPSAAVFVTGFTVIFDSIAYVFELSRGYFGNAAFDFACYLVLIVQAAYYAERCR